MALAALKTELKTWNAALEANDAGNFTEALVLFQEIADTSKIWVNMGLIQRRIERYNEAVRSLTSAIALDPSLVLAYYERGVCYHALNKCSQALDDFIKAESRMKGSSAVHYDETGLAFTLHLAEVQFNKGCVLIQLGRQPEGIATLRKTIFLKALHADRVIQGVHVDPSRLLRLLRVPPGRLYRPTDSKIKFLEQYDMDIYTYADDKFATSSRKASGSFYSHRSDASSTCAPSFDSFPSSPKKWGYHRRHTSESLPPTPQISRTELNKAMGPDMTTPTTDITTIPCAGLRISHGKLAGLMGWRFAVELDTSPSSKYSGTPRKSVVTNFILDTGIGKSHVPAETLMVLGYSGSLKPGAEVALRIQGIRTKCLIAHEGEAGRLCGQFLTSGSLTLYFDTKLDAPVLYGKQLQLGKCIRHSSLQVADDNPDAASIPRTIQPL
ncbi:TPR-like protein, partial [Guyanagaster necrorhizus]